MPENISYRNWSRVEALGAEGGSEAITNSKPYFDYDDSYTHWSTWYLIVFKPYNDQYKKIKDWYTHKGMDYVRKQLPKGKYLITRETESEKVHINVLISTEKDLKPWHEKAGRKYKLWCKPLEHQAKDCDDVYDYITKEAETRPFEKFSDYIINYGGTKRNEVGKGSPKGRPQSKKNDRSRYQAWTAGSDSE